MRIISPFHDYYDVVQSQGQDHSLIYQRRERTITPKKYPFPVMHRWWRHYPGDLSLYQKIIGFCGKIYPVFYLEAVAMTIHVAKRVQTLQYLEVG